jgi:hypothetical protein
VPFDRLATEVRTVRDDEYAATQRSEEEARATCVATRQQLVIATVVALLAALTDHIQHAATRRACSAKPTARSTRPRRRAATAW